MLLDRRALLRPLKYDNMFSDQPGISHMRTRNDDDRKRSAAKAAAGK
jgi:hypothetical protein